MTNFELLILYTLVDFFIAFLAYRFFGKNGLIIFIVFSVIAANIQVNKGIDYTLLGHTFSATMGNVMFGGIFLANDLLNEKYGKYVARRAVYISIFAGLSFVTLMCISTVFQSITTDKWYTQTNDALNLFFSINGSTLKAILIGNMVFLVSQLFDVFIYSKLKSYNSELKWLWLRNSGSTAISQIIDTTLITYGFAYAGIIPMEYALEMVFTTLLIKYIITLINAPLFYLIAFVKPKKWI